MVIISSYWLARERAAEIDPRFIISLMDPGSGYSIPSGSNLEHHLPGKLSLRTICRLSRWCQGLTRILGCRNA
jgi:hypothetical protein